MSAPNPQQTQAVNKCEAILQFFKDAEANGNHVAFSHMSYPLNVRVGKVTCENEDTKDWKRLNFQVLEWSWLKFKPAILRIEEHTIYPTNAVERPSPDKLVVDQEFVFKHYTPYNPLWKFQ
jgi:hypothetical protein